MMQLTRIPGAIKVNHLNNAYWSTQRTTDAEAENQRMWVQFPRCLNYQSAYLGDKMRFYITLHFIQYFLA